MKRLSLFLPLTLIAVVTGFTSTPALFPPAPGLMKKQTDVIKREFADLEQLEDYFVLTPTQKMLEKRKIIIPKGDHDYEEFGFGVDPTRYIGTDASEAGHYNDLLVDFPVFRKTPSEEAKLKESRYAWIRRMLPAGDELRTDGAPPSSLIARE